MGMNIGSMLRAFMGNAAPADGRTLELRIGQIVRGILMEMLDGGEALMNINGVSVRARLEADLPVGRGTLLQVQPGSQGGAIVLKPLADASDVAPDEALKNVLKQFGMPDQKWSYELLRGLRRDGYALDSEAASFFRTATAAKPAAAETAGWMAAADVAFRRGLNASEATLAALRQTLFGQPLHEELSGFASIFRQWMADRAGSVAGRAPEWAGALQRLLAEGEQLLAQGSAQLAGAVAGTADAAAAASGGTSAAGRADIPAAAGRAAIVSGTAIAADNAPAAQTAALAAEARTAAQAGAAPRAEAAAAQPAGGRMFAVSDAGLTAARLPQAAESADSRPVPANGQPASAGEPARTGAAPTASAASDAAQRGGDSWIGRFLQWLGVGHENRLLQTAADSRPLLQPQTQPGMPNALHAPLAGEGEAVPSVPQQAGDTLKSALLSLIAHDDAPPALREAAQSLANHITGQQLLLSSERQFNQPYSFMTLFVPMKGQDGEATATVHVQTRRSRKGEWDANNCRLLFDLRMHHLGSTLVDVQVVDRIVSMKLLSDYPGLKELLNQAREELDEGLRSAGFQLLSLNAQPFPDASESASGDAGEAVERTHGPLPASASAFASKPYKGVDYRI